MGDKRRFRRFAEFIEQTFPEATTIADVAGGRGELSFWLHEIGRRPVIVDPRKAALPRWIRRKLRKQSIRSGRLVTIERLKRPVERVDLGTFDLVAALHPDGATEPALRGALRHGVAFAIVPCCVFALDGVKRSREEWVAYLVSLAPGVRVAELPISGANLVLWRRGKDVDQDVQGCVRNRATGHHRGMSPQFSPIVA